LKLQFGLFTMLVVVAAYANFAFACCGNCDHEAHDHEHGATKEATMSNTGSNQGTVATEDVTLEPTRFVVLEGTLADPAAVWTRLPELAGAQGLLGEGTHAWSIVPQMPSGPGDDVPYMAGFTLAEGATPSGELSEHTTPGGAYVKAVHKGPYEGLAESWMAFATQVMHSGRYDASRPMMEHYVSDPGNTPAEDLITHMYIPVK
jgi:DNA gyrase inhibitor GyrI